MKKIEMGNKHLAQYNQNQKLKKSARTGAKLSTTTHYISGCLDLSPTPLP